MTILRPDVFVVFEWDGSALTSLFDPKRAELVSVAGRGRTVLRYQPAPEPKTEPVRPPAERWLVIFPNAGPEIPCVSEAIAKQMASEARGRIVAHYALVPTHGPPPVFERAWVTLDDDGDAEEVCSEDYTQPGKRVVAVIPAAKLTSDAWAEVARLRAALENILKHNGDVSHAFARTALEGK